VVLTFANNLVVGSLYTSTCRVRLQQSSLLGRGNRKQYGGDHVTRRRERELEHRETTTGYYHSGSVGARSTPVDARPAGGADVENETSVGNRIGRHESRQYGDLRRRTYDDERDHGKRWTSGMDKTWTYGVSNDAAVERNENLRSTSVHSRTSQNYHHQRYSLHVYT